MFQADNDLIGYLLDQRFRLQSVIGRGRMSTVYKAKHLTLDTKAIRDPGNGTDPAGAIQLALAALHRDAMHRLLLLWDGNATAGDLDGALAGCGGPSRASSGVTRWRKTRSPCSRRSPPSFPPSRYTSRACWPW